MFLRQHHLLIIVNYFVPKYFAPHNNTTTPNTHRPMSEHDDETKNPSSMNVKSKLKQQFFFRVCARIFRQHIYKCTTAHQIRHHDTHGRPSMRRADQKENENDTHGIVFDKMRETTKKITVLLSILLAFA